jgi:hypothetical protein
MLKKVDDDVKHIEVEPTPEEIAKAAFNNNLRKESTLNQYVSQILRLHALSGGSRVIVPNLLTF